MGVSVRTEMHARQSKLANLAPGEAITADESPPRVGDVVGREEDGCSEPGCGEAWPCFEEEIVETVIEGDHDRLTVLSSLVSEALECIEEGDDLKPLFYEEIEVLPEECWRCREAIVRWNPELSVVRDAVIHQDGNGKPRMRKGLAYDPGYYMHCQEPIYARKLHLHGGL